MLKYLTFRGRNSRLGSYLGEGFRLSHILAQQMAGDTVEGVDTGKNLESAFHAALKNKDLPSGQLPLTHAILKCISSDSLFEFDFSSLPT